MKTLAFHILIGLFTCVTGLAQSLTLLKEVSIPISVAVSLDRYSNIYAGDKKGNVFKYDSTGNLLQTFSSPAIANISSVEAWASLQVFVFYRDSQQFSILNRFMVPAAYSTPINQEVIGFARSATLGTQESLWLFDDTDFSIKRYDLTSNRLSLHTPLTLILNEADYQINYMREYQNALFVNDANSGILVFDNLGNYKKKLPFAGLTYINFHENQLYYLKDNTLHFFDIYRLTEKSLSLPGSFTYNFALFSGTRIFLFANHSLLIYQLN